VAVCNKIPSSVSENTVAVGLDLDESGRPGGDCEESFSFGKFDGRALLGHILI
jgi:hypothetical protein